MGQEPYKTLLLRARTQWDNAVYGAAPSSTADITNLLNPRDESYISHGSVLKDYCNYRSSNDNRREPTDTLLLEVVRAKSREYEEAQDKTLDLPRDDVSEDPSEPCIHGLSMRMTDRSISRRSMSRVSRLSTRRDMDIPSILAFTATAAPAPAPLENPDFQKVASVVDAAIPRFSVRRYACPVCSQKWKDRSSIEHVKYSGLKKNPTADLPTVGVSARLRSSIEREYIPRPYQATVDDDRGVMRISSATWQLTRARRFRTPKLQMPSPEEAAPPISTEPMAMKDLDTRVHNFVKDKALSQYFVDAGFTYKP